MNAKSDPKPGADSSDRSATYGPRAISEISGKIVAKPLGKRGFAAAALAADWPAIVGASLGTATLPLRIVFPRGQRNQAFCICAYPPAPLPCNCSISSR